MITVSIMFILCVMLTIAVWLYRFYLHSQRESIMTYIEEYLVSALVASLVTAVIWLVYFIVY